MKRLKLKGFTLIELIVVLVIIGILFAAAVAGYTNWTEVSKQRTHVQNIKILDDAAMVYQSEYDLLPDGSIANDYVDSTSTVAVDVTNPVFTRAAGGAFAGEPAALLNPITDEHPLVALGYIKEAPKNPWSDNPRFKDFVYVLDFKTTAKMVTNPDGSYSQIAKVAPVARLMKFTDTQLERDEIIVVAGNKTLRTQSDEGAITDTTFKASLNLYGYDFGNRLSVGDADGDLVTTSPTLGATTKVAEKPFY